MPEIRPFNAIRYAAGGEISALIAPPYDVLGESDKAAMLARDRHNIVAVDLPHTPPKSAGPARAYLQAAETLRAWLGRGVLARDRAPAVYAYQQRFEIAGRPVVRRGFIARLRAEQFRASPTGVFPHEQTFSGPKEDRLMLTRAARCQLSPIFGLYADEHNQVVHELYANLPDHPTMTGRLGDVLHEAWRVDNARKIAALAEAMSTRPVFIADGHHRYTTALNYLAELEKKGPLPGDHPARFVMFVCVSMHDPGLAIMPTHRVLTVPRFDMAEYAARLAGPFEVKCGDWPAEQLEAEVLRRGPGWFGVASAATAGPCGGQAGTDRPSGSMLLRLVQRDLLDHFEALRGPAYRRLDVAILHRFLIEETLSGLAGEPISIEYPHSGRDAAAALMAGGVDAATAFGSGGADLRPAAGDSGSAGLQPTPDDSDRLAPGDSTKVAFILAPTPLSAVRDVCLAGDLMPQKSTFFFPKLATGLALYDLSE